MIVEKDGAVYDLKEQAHIDAFLAAGWTERKAPYAKPEPAEEPAGKKGGRKRDSAGPAESQDT